MVNLPVTTRWIEDVATFQTLEADWDGLLANHLHGPSPFLSYAWCSLWRQHLGSGMQLAVLAAYQTDDGADTDDEPGDLADNPRAGAAGRLVGLLPLVRERSWLRGFQLTRLILMGSGIAAGDHLDAILHVDHALSVADALVAALIADRVRWDLLRLEGLHADSLMIEAWTRATGEVPKPRAKLINPYLLLPASWDEYLAGLSSNRRQQVRRFPRKLEQAFPDQVCYQTVETLEQCRAVMESLYGLHQSIQTGHGRGGAFARPAMRVFHDAVAEAFLKRGWLRLHHLQINGRDSAVIYCFRYGAEVNFYATGFDPALADYRAGRLIMQYAIRHAIEEGAVAFDFLRGDEDYKRGYTDEQRLELDLWLPGSSSIAALLAVDVKLRTAQSWVKRLLKKGGIIASVSVSDPSP